MFKLFGVLLLTGILMFGTGVVSAAEDSVEPDNYWHYWEIDDTNKNVGTTPIGEWEQVYEGEPADRDGEKQTAEASLTETAEVTGTIEVSSSSIAAAVSVTEGGSYTVGGSTTSSPLDEGEYIKGYARPIASVHEVIQREYIRSDGQDIPTDNTATAYVEEPTGVNIDIEYYDDGANAMTDSDVEPDRVERYTVVDGEKVDKEILKD
ncbi:hypothetical protein [Natranaerobius thermophilus]|uniref:Uncharacterized protein n=1 Tax=Natranaerobius thermophilus (strain ATCC BAA-1301 / DSM 18059 / JW/NM-WN-LF) TaxID=457570 RepID=B2A1W9_NATTJ|nr:hypothetical protein [Natranaerobius thermophilus]ACB86166.1 hypothetical protein Nther_2610 [Natranaerobius thermophilus JW/NM-WN-LF]